MPDFLKYLNQDRSFSLQFAVPQFQMSRKIPELNLFTIFELGMTWLSSTRWAHVAPVSPLSSSPLLSALSNNSSRRPESI